MHYRPLGSTGWEVSDISFGAWAIGGNWGQVSDQESLAALDKAIECGVNFIDTADVYGDGRSERLIGKFKKRHTQEIIVATKAGRRLPKQAVESYNRQNLTSWVEDSLRNLSVDSLDLLQLHCPPTALYDRSEVFGILDDLVRAGKIRHYGVSVEKVEEALRVIEYPGVQTVQIIFNCFRPRPAEEFFSKARQRKIGILARIPLSSGMLTGKFRTGSVFPPDDHRNFNRHGESFDVGETFSGVDFEASLKAVEDLRRLVPAGVSMAQFALRWILMFEVVSCAIPGAKRPEQVVENCRASDLPRLTDGVMAGVRRIYESQIMPLIKDRW